MNCGRWERGLRAGLWGMLRGFSDRSGRRRLSLWRIRLKGSLF